MITRLGAGIAVLVLGAYGGAGSAVAAGLTDHVGGMVDLDATALPEILDGLCWETAVQVD
ncbi:MAG: hypothetical protein R6V31_00745 [Halohasta sp.]